MRHLEWRPGESLVTCVTGAMGFLVLRGSQPARIGHYGCSKTRMTAMTGELTFLSLSVDDVRRLAAEKPSAWDAILQDAVVLYGVSPGEVAGG